MFFFFFFTGEWSLGTRLLCPKPVLGLQVTDAGVHAIEDQLMHGPAPTVVKALLYVGTIKL